MFDLAYFSISFDQNLFNWTAQERYQALLQGEPLKRRSFGVSASTRRFSFYSLGIRLEFPSHFQGGREGRIH